MVVVVLLSVGGRCGRDGVLGRWQVLGFDLQRHLAVDRRPEVVAPVAAEVSGGRVVGRGDRWARVGHVGRAGGQRSFRRVRRQVWDEVMLRLKWWWWRMWPHLWRHVLLLLMLEVLVLQLLQWRRRRAVSRYWRRWTCLSLLLLMKLRRAVVVAILWDRLSGLDAGLWRLNVAIWWRRLLWSLLTTFSATILEPDLKICMEII